MRLAPAESWPDLRVTFRLLPWAWKLKPYLWRDDVTPTAVLEWLFLTVEWQANRPLFRVDAQDDHDADCPASPARP